MLEKVLNHLHNRFEREHVDGTFTVSGNTLVVDGLQDDQYFWVDGSVFNDGLHQYPDDEMTDETFDGTITFMAVPKAVIDLAAEIGAWCTANAKAIDSPYQSESFDGYSYSKGSGSGNGDGATATWQSHFCSQLNTWRKLS